MKAEIRLVRGEAEPEVWAEVQRWIKVFSTSPEDEDTVPQSDPRPSVR